jgi:dihydroflavonol-4-reductase
LLNMVEASARERMLAAVQSCIHPSHLASPLQHAELRVESQCGDKKRKLQSLYYKLHKLGLYSALAKIMIHPTSRPPTRSYLTRARVSHISSCHTLNAKAAKTARASEFQHSAEMNNSGSPVLVTEKFCVVTGCSSFIGGHVVSQLLHKGYKVRGTVRSKETSQYQHLLRLVGGDTNRLEIVEANLLDPASWEKVFEGGVEYVFHVAAPYILKPPDPETTLLLPIVEGTQHILEMCQKTESVKKLIFTSCMAAVSDDWESNTIYDEEHWNTSSSLTRNSYAYTKALAEMACTNFAGRPDCNFKLVSLLPFVVLGPPIGPNLSFSHKFLMSFLNKQIRVILDISYNISDVRDVAIAQVQAMEHDDIEGRYCFCNDALRLDTLLQIVHETFHGIDLPTRKVTNFAVKLLTKGDASFRGEFLQYNLGKVPKVNCNRAIAAGMFMRPSVQTIVDTVRYIIDKRFLEAPLQPRAVTCSIM